MNGKIYKSLERLHSTFNKTTLKEELSKKYLSLLENAEGVYIWGTGKLGMFAYEQCKKNGLNVIGFIDNDKSKAGSNIDNVPVIFGGGQINIGTAIIIVCSMHFVEIAAQVKKIPAISLYYEILPIIDNTFQTWGMAFKEMVEKLDIYRNQYAALFEKCNDEISKDVLDCVLNYRFTLEETWLEIAYNNSVLSGGCEYFDREILCPQKDEVYIDCGGYTGDTVLKFLEFAKNNYKKVYYLEPNEVVYKKGEENLKNIENVTFIKAGVGSCSGIFRFSGEGIVDSGHMDEKGTECIEVVSLDECISEMPTFIKMDIEGAERDALCGAYEIIRKSRPRMAICVYHKPEDLFEILKLIDSWELNYHYYFRHYSKGMAGTVLYCIPD